MSVELTEWAELASSVESPVAANLISLLRSMAEMTDAELLRARVTTTVTLWSSGQHGYDEALGLPEGSVCADIEFLGFLVQQSISDYPLFDTIAELKSKDIAITATTQAEILVKAQQNGLLQEYNRLVLA